MLLTVLPEWNSDLGWVRIWDFPRVQVAVLILLDSALLLWAARGRGVATWTAVAAGAAALAWQATHVVPYSPIVAREVASLKACEPGRSLSMLNVNVLQENRDYARLLELVDRADPDVLLLLETDSGWAEAVAPLASEYPSRIERPLPNTYGMMLFSRLPLEGDLLHRVKPDVPSIDASVELPGGQVVKLHAIHPEPPLPGDPSGDRDVELVLAGRDIRESGRAAVLLGDLNDVGWSDTSRLFRQVSGMLDPRIGRGLYPTFHADYVFARWPLDHLFVTEHFELLEMKRLDSIGSDHFPIFYRICLAEDAGRTMAPPEPAPAVEAEARNEVREGRSQGLE